MPTTQWTGGSRSPSSEGTLQGSGTPLQKKVRALLQFYITHLLLQEKTAPAIVYSSLAFLNHLWLLPLFTFVTGLFLWRIIFRTLGGVLYDTVLCLVIHRVYLFLLEKQWLSICPGLWKSRLDDQKETIMLPHSGEALPSQDWHSRMWSGFPLSGWSLNQTLSQGDVREMLVCCRIKYIRETQSDRAKGLHC